jgi:hypothetical protein
MKAVKIDGDNLTLEQTEEVALAKASVKIDPHVGNGHLVRYRKECH